MTVALLASLIWQVIDTFREIAGRRWSAVVTQCSAWAGGIVVVWIAAHAAATETLVMPGTDLALGKLDGWSIVLVGLLASSLASSLVDVKASIDNTDTAAKPPLLPPRS